MKSLILSPFSINGQNILRKYGEVIYEPWTETKRLYDPRILGDRLTKEDIDCLVVEADFLFEELFESSQNLKYGAICRAGLNQVDLEAATDHGVVIIHTPGRNAQAVAELVFALIFSLARQIPQANTYVQENRWEDPSEPYIRFRGLELEGSTIGLIGLGGIGGKVAEIADKLNMRVLAYDPYLSTFNRGQGNLTLTSLNHVFKEADFVTIHVPETEETIGMVDRNILSLMKPSAYLINVTSSAILDINALARMLKEGNLSGAALDVHESHPIAPNSPILGLPNTILTPHIGGATRQTIDRHSKTVAFDLTRLINGIRPKYFANPSVWAQRRQ